jgi:hypothetical protein
VTLVDPTLAPARRVAQEEVDRAAAEVRRFVKENADALAAEDAATTRSDFAQAIQEADVESAAGILRLTQEPQERREAAPPP